VSSNLEGLVSAIPRTAPGPACRRSRFGPNRLVQAALLTCCLVGCDQLTREEHAAITAWMECDDCFRGKRDSLRAIGDRATDVLSCYLAKGPPKQRRREVEQYLGRFYLQLRDYALTHAELQPISDSADFASAYLGSFDRKYRIRAAYALGFIASPRALTALREAAADSSTPTGVLPAVNCSLYPKRCLR